MFDVFELQKMLANTARPASFEKDIGVVLCELAKPFVDQVYTDTLGNIICCKKGNGKKIIVSAHMDTIGFLINYIDDDGYLYFQPIGLYCAADLINQTVLLEGGIYGAVQPLPSAMGKKAKNIKTCDLYIDIGAINREEAEGLVKIGSYGAFDSEPVHMGANSIRTPHADNAVGCITVLLAMEQMKQTANDIYFVFTTMQQPPPGSRGAMAATYHIKPYAGISIDATGTKDTPCKSHSGSAKLGKGPAIKIKEDRYLCDTIVINHLREVAETYGIEYQNEIWPLGSTDMNSPINLTDMVAVQNSRAGVLSGAISIPVRYFHSSAEVYNIDDVVEAGRLLAAALEKTL